MSGVITARCWSDSAVGERLSCVFGGETGWRGGDKFGCDGCGDWNVAVLQGPAATAARWFAMTDGVVPGVMRGGRVYEAEVPGPGPDIVAEREYPDEKELGLPSSRRGDWARMSGPGTEGCSDANLRRNFGRIHTESLACFTEVNDWSKRIATVISRLSVKRHAGHEP